MTEPQAQDLFRDRIQSAIDTDRENMIAWGYADRFQERSAPDHNIGDFIRAVLGIETEAEARAFFDGYVRWLESAPDRTLPALDVARANVGWCFGEGMARERVAMWHRATGSAHPVFGTSKPPPEQAFAAGMNAARKRGRS
jgi:hypothetical protein